CVVRPPALGGRSVGPSGAGRGGDDGQERQHGEDTRTKLRHRVSSLSRDSFTRELPSLQKSFSQAPRSTSARRGPSPAPGARHRAITRMLCSSRRRSASTNPEARDTTAASLTTWRGTPNRGARSSTIIIANVEDGTATLE